MFGQLYVESDCYNKCIYRDNHQVGRWTKFNSPKIPQSQLKTIWVKFRESNEFAQSLEADVKEERKYRQKQTSIKIDLQVWAQYVDRWKSDKTES